MSYHHLCAIPLPMPLLTPSLMPLPTPSLTPLPTPSPMPSLVLKLSQELLCCMLTTTDIEAVYNLSFACKTMHAALKPLRLEIHSKAKVLMQAQDYIFARLLDVRPHYFADNPPIITCKTASKAIAVYDNDRGETTKKLLIAISALAPNHNSNAGGESSKLYCVYVNRGDENTERKNLLIRPTINAQAGTYIAFEPPFMSNHNTSVDDWLPYSEGVEPLLREAGYFQA